MANEDESNGPENDGAHEAGQPNEQSERDLFVACMLREKDALAKLHEKYREAVHLGACKALAPVSGRLSCDVDDLVQIFFKDLCADPLMILGGFDPTRGNLIHFLAGVAYRRSTKVIRSWEVRWVGKTRTTDPQNLATVSSLSDGGPNPVDVVDRLLEKLSDTSRGIIEAKFGLGSTKVPLSAQEIADRLGWSVSQVYKYLRHILKRLYRERKLLEVDPLE